MNTDRVLRLALLAGEILMESGSKYIEQKIQQESSPKATSKCRMFSCQLNIYFQVTVKIKSNFINEENYKPYCRSSQN